jgi:hypothetical protein
MLVGISQGGLIRRYVDSEMNQLAQTTGQPVADLAQRVGVSQLAEQHRHQLCTATETLRRFFRLVFLHQSGKFQFWKMPQQLIKQAHCLYHRFALLLGIRQPNSSVKKVVGAGSIIGGAYFFLSSGCFGHE